MAPRVGGDIPFKLTLSGYGGQLSLEPLPPVCRDSSDTVPELVLPPAFPSETPKSVLESLENEYLTPSLDQEIDDASHCGKFWEINWHEEGSQYWEPSLSCTTIAPIWEPPFRRKNPEVWLPKYEQVGIEHVNQTAGNSSSFLRRPGPPENFVRGSTTSHPFHPGGFELSQSGEKYLPEGAKNGEWFDEVLNGSPLQTTAPGLKHGLNLGVPEPFIPKCPIRSSVSLSVKETYKETDTLHFDKLFEKAWEEELIEEESRKYGDEGQAIIKISEHAVVAEEESTALEEILSTVEALEPPKQQSVPNDTKAAEAWVVIGGDVDIIDSFHELIPDMAISFPFELDPFQKEAIYHLEQNRSVFVAAHTSAGKTVVAEYAFALAAKHCTRAVYTSPIKTISNQKFRDFSEKFDVGLLTGDISIRPEASCLIMTTEILRSMLYKGADIVRDIEWVIFDEVHYVNDAERGVVWEEVIIMLPDHVNMVLLSATVPNITEFADWVGRTKRKKIYVTVTHRRPVPLEHCLCYSGELYKICDNEIFLPEGVKIAKDIHYAKNSSKRGIPGGGGRGGSTPRGGGGQGRGAGRVGRGKPTVQVPDSNGQRGNGAWRAETSQWYSLINKLAKDSLLPIVVFCFSKNRCDQSADSLTASDLTSSSEKSEIRVFCDKAFSRLKGSDRQLPQVVRVQELLRRGIGVHHAGLLPIVKEVVEMLFCRGVIKILFSTETFAMGVNAPARTVAFHSLRKHDGKTFRQLHSEEYIQMAGRAGRRGIDKVGTVLIMCWDEVPDEGDLRRLLTGKPTKLESQFRLTYNMLLNLLRVEELKIEDMLKRSFAEFHTQRALPEHEQKLLENEGELLKMTSTIDCTLCSTHIEEYYELASEAARLGEDVQETLMQSKTAQQYLVPGRIIMVAGKAIVPFPSLGVIIRGPAPNGKVPIVLVLYRNALPLLSSEPPRTSNIQKFGEGYFISKKGNREVDDDYTLSVGSRKGAAAVKISLPHYGTVTGANYVVMELHNSDSISIWKEKIRIDPLRILEDVNPAAYSAAVQQLLQLEDKFQGKEPVVDPTKDLRLLDLNTVDKYQKRQRLMERLAQNQCSRCPRLQEHYTVIQNHHLLKEAVRKLRFQISDASLQQMPDFNSRMNVLQDVGCIDAELIVQMKGRAACEINSGDELIATECLFDNQLMDLDPCEAVALLSALVFQQKDTSKPKLTTRLAVATDRLFHTALRLGDIQENCGLGIKPEDYAREALKFGLVEVVYEWAKGTPFSDICELTDVPEGSIVRTIVRLDETCKEFKSAARIMGDNSLYQKMDEASNAIKRDIVFAASLYVTGLPTS